MYSRRWASAAELKIVPLNMQRMYKTALLAQAIQRGQLRVKQSGRWVHRQKQWPHH
jgi:hypothetical protein